MKKFINHIDTLLDESLAGFATAHADIITVHSHPQFVKRLMSTRANKVALISGGG